MAKPIILTVDDEEQVRSAVERDLARHYRQNFRIIKASSGAEGLETVRRLKQRNDAVALFLVDQRMPEMSGTEFLEEAREVYPEARKVLLTAYADTEAAISAINTVGLDHYLMKPWTPAEENLYPVLDDLISDWEATATLPYEGIRVAGALWSASSHNIKDFLARSQVPYQFLDVERDTDARSLVEQANQVTHKLPVVFFPDGSVLVEPTLTEVAEKAGFSTHATEPFYDLIVVGAGPAGLAAAVYGASEGVKTLLIDKETPGGQAGTSSRIENYLGFPKGLSGADLARRATAQASRLGAEILSAQEVVSIEIRDPYRVVKLANGSELICRALVIASGVSVRELKVPGIESVTGAGVYYGAALSEAASYKGEHVYVIGGANSAGQGAVFLSQYAEQVSMLVRSSLAKSMSQYLIEQIEECSNIDVQLGAEVVEVHGSNQLEAITIRDRETGATRRESTPAIFVFIGAQPHTNMLGDLVELSSAGFILTGPDLILNGKRAAGWKLKRDPYLMETSIPGIFAAGDVRHGVIRRVASAVGQGSTAISFVHEYLKTV
ncbi:MAG: FAD-dependent oxidoreductase [Arenicellales bacterium]|nr:FAD-dependent oxidoreductase [Arenicellales bacterium]